MNSTVTGCRSECSAEAGYVCGAPLLTCRKRKLHWPREIAEKGKAHSKATCEKMSNRSMVTQGATRRRAVIALHRARTAVPNAARTAFAPAYDHHVDQASPYVGEQLLQGWALQRGAREAAVVVLGGQAAPALVGLALDVEPGLYIRYLGRLLYRQRITRYRRVSSFGSVRIYGHRARTNPRLYDTKD